MKLKTALEKLGPEAAVAMAQELAGELDIPWAGGVQVVFDAIVNDFDRVPGNIGGNKDDEETVIQKWLSRYQSGKDNRASQRISNPPGTIADPIIENIIGSRLTSLGSADLEKITYAHRLGMSAENILGLLLEEYLADNLQPAGWHCAWGETVRSVDFVHQSGRLLQIKNRSNSENSSSSKVREGTQIDKWFRIRADRVEYMWGELNKICGTNHLSEDAFVQFVQTTLAQNPKCLAVEPQNPWGKTGG